MVSLKIAIKDEDIIISDPGYDGCDLSEVTSLELSLWDPTKSTNSCVKDFLRKRQRRTRLECIAKHMSSDSTFFIGWDSLSCHQRLLFIQRLLHSKKNCMFTSRDVVDYLKCSQCIICTSPQWCSLRSKRCCIVPDVQPVKCSQCDQTVHRVCQQDFEKTNGFPINSLEYCLQCIPQLSGAELPQTRSRTTGSTRRFPSISRQTNTVQPMSSSFENRCCNCQRSHESIDIDPLYSINLRSVDATEILKGSKHILVKKSSDHRDTTQYRLCDECYAVCGEGKKTFQYTWPVWLWKQLSGSVKTKFCGTIHLNQVYGKKLWKMVPLSMRHWWLTSIHSINHFGYCPYQDCTINDPPPYFVDRTVELRDYKLKMDSGRFGDMISGLSNEQINMPNVLCPFQCTEYCTSCGDAPFDVLFQHAFDEVPIELSDPSMEKKLKNYNYMYSRYFRDDNKYDCILLNPDWPIRPTVLIHPEKGLVVLTCLQHSGGSDLYQLYPPQPPYHNLAAEQSDQLSHVTIKPRSVRPTIAHQYSTTYGMSKIQANFNGVDTMNIGTHSSWEKPSILLRLHETWCIRNRPDMVQLLHQKVEKEQISTKVSEFLLEYASNEYHPDVIEQCINGSTFVPAQLVYKMHIARTHRDKYGYFITVLLPSRNGEVEEVSCRPPWPPLINLVQKQDSSGYGQSFRPIPRFGSEHRPSLMTWVLISMISSVNTLYEAIYAKTTPWHKDAWEGHIMAAVRSEIFSFIRTQGCKKCPFKGNLNNADLVDIVNRTAFRLRNSTSDPMDIDLPTSHRYMFSHEIMNELFPEQSYPTISVVDSIEDLLCYDAYLYAQKEIIILVLNNNAPGEEYIPYIRDGLDFREDVQFQCQHIIVARCQQNVYNPNPNKFDSIRFMRHSGHSGWFKQERDDKFVTKCDFNNSPDSMIGRFDSDGFDSTSVLVFVRTNDFQVDDWKLKFHESLGGQTHVLCQCSNFPLIPTHMRKDKKRACMKCGKSNESFVCCNLKCNVRLCKKCYDSYPVDDISIVEPPISCSDNQQMFQSTSDPIDSESDSESDCESQYESSCCDGSQSSSSISDNDSLSIRTPVSLSKLDNEGDDYDDDDSFQSGFMPYSSGNNDHSNRMIHNDYNIDQDETIDDTDLDAPFHSTHAGDEHIQVEQDTRYDRVVSGAVIFNQAAVCLVRKRGRLNSTQLERHMIQSLCSTVPDQATPLIYPEACLHPRCFPASATTDSLSILGALPIFAYGADSRANGFPHPAQITRQRLTASGSLTSTDIHYLKGRHTVGANTTLSHGDSRDILKRGFNVDPSSRTGLSLNRYRQSDLSDQIDSDYLVMGLSASQEFVKYDLWGTVTCNQSLTPGVCGPTNWVKSLHWLSHIHGHENMSSYDIDELHRSMEESAASIKLRQWIQFRAAYISQQFQKISVKGGKAVAIFARDEYQALSGNLPHLHYVVVIDKKALGPNAQEKIMAMFRTSPYEMIKSEDLQSFIDEGLLKSEHEVGEKLSLATEILSHKCGPRCQMRVGSGDGPENFKCRKPHSVFDTPDPTRDCFVPIPFNFLPQFDQLMERMGFCTILNEKASYNLPFFKASRHMSPCMSNCNQNISVNIPEWFLTSLSMTNHQFCGGVTTLSKYILKYASKRDKTTRIDCNVNAHNGSINIGSTFLHNTKIDRSRRNEEIAHSRSRNSSHPTGIMIPNLELLHHLLGIPEITTNMSFVNISTSSYETRSRFRINLGNDGAVIRRQTHNDSSGNEESQNASQRRPAGRDRRGFARQRDEHVDGIWIDKLRRRHITHEYRMFTPYQLEIIFDDRIESRRYDHVSVYGVRPPELTRVIVNLALYYRLCVIGQTIYSDVANKLNDTLNCRWVDGFGRLVRFRKSTLDELHSVIENNLRILPDTSSDDFLLKYDGNDELILRDFGIGEPVLNTEILSYHRQINQRILWMMELYITDDDLLSEEDQDFKHDHLPDFFFDDSCRLPDIPVLSQVNPVHTEQWLIHIILSLGMYITERDAFDHASIKHCLNATKLITLSTDESICFGYVLDILSKYIKKQLQYYSISVYKAMHFILRGNRTLEDVIIHDTLPLFQLPFTMLALQDKVDDENAKIWPDKSKKLLDAIYFNLSNTPGIPARDDVEKLSRFESLDWEPTESLVRSSNQNEESFKEQMEALNCMVSALKNLVNAISGRPCSMYSKNVVVNGAPGSGKSFCGFISLLYAKCQGLNAMSTAIDARKAANSGGLHLHPLFCFPVNNTKTNVHPMKIAESAIERIMKSPKILYLLRTLDFLYIDEIGKLSSEYMTALDIILRKVRDSTILYGGVHIQGSCDHAQIPSPNASPFMTSTHTLTSYIFVQLNQSVRAHSEPEFQKIQQLARMNPNALRQNPTHLQTFKQLVSSKITFVPSIDSPIISPSARYVFPRNAEAKSFLHQMTDVLLEQLRANGTNHVVCNSVDVEAPISSHVSWKPASQSNISAMNRQYREPPRLVFTPYCLYEITTNDTEHGTYHHTNHALLIDLPNENTISNHLSIEMLLVPTHIQHVDFLESNDPSTYPTKDELVNMGWNVIRIKPTPLREVTIRGTYRVKRKQYSLRHIGSGTIDSCQGDTIYTQLVFECSALSSPWLKAHIVVLLSRTPTAAQIVIIGDKQWAIERLTQLICTPTQWTQYMDRMINMLSINVGDSSSSQRYALDLNQVYPFKISSFQLPSEPGTGFVYVLCSMKDPDFNYIGECQDIVKRLRAHNSGRGAEGTMNVNLQPFFIAAYITGFVQNSKAYRMQFETRVRNERDSLRDRATVLNTLSAAEKVVSHHNSESRSSAISGMQLELLTISYLISPS